MFAALSSFLWGTKEDAQSDVQTSDASLSSIKEDVCPIDCLPPAELSDFSDVRSSPEPVLSTASLSGEETGWVFVNSSESKCSDSEMESASEDLAPMVPDSESMYLDIDYGHIMNPLLPCGSTTERASPSAIPAVTRKSSNQHVKGRTLPGNVSHASSVLTAIAAIRPQQKAERRQKELRLKHRQLERSNQVHLVNHSSNKPPRRRHRYAPDMSSRVSNNRKC